VPRVCRANIDRAGGIILGGSSTVFIDGYPVALEGNRVADHGNNEHDSAIVIGGASRFVVDGIPVILEGTSRATCGHIALSTSSVEAL
jgi:uncharacterized Zn-binding protein involved in type VI secretion